MRDFWLGEQDRRSVVGQNHGVWCATMRLSGHTTRSTNKTVQCLTFYLCMWGLYQIKKKSQDFEGPYVRILVKCGTLSQ